MSLDLTAERLDLAGRPPTISEKMKPWAKDLQAMHGIEKLEFGTPSGDGFVEVQLPESEEVIYVRPPSPAE